MKDPRKGLFYCALLALQFGLQPILVNQFVGSDVSRISLVIGTEFTKIMIALSTVLGEPEAKRKAAVGAWTFQHSLKYAALPATLYAVQNLLIQHGYVNLDSMTFNLLSQTKTLSAAFWLWIIMGQKQSFMQMIALFLLLVAAVLLNYKGSTSTKMSTSSTLDYQFGLFCCLTASGLSGLSGALVQRALSGPTAQNPFLYTAELALYGISFLLVSSLFSSKDRVILLSGNLFSAWELHTMIPVIANAMGGLIVGMVTKYAGSVVKGFALIAGIIVTGCVQWVIKGTPLSIKDYSAIALVSYAIYLHSSYPYKKHEYIVSVSARAWDDGKNTPSHMPRVDSTTSVNGTNEMDLPPAIILKDIILPHKADKTVTKPLSGPIEEAPISTTTTATMNTEVSSKSISNLTATSLNSPNGGSKVNNNNNNINTTTKKYSNGSITSTVASQPSTKSSSGSLSSNRTVSKDSKIISSDAMPDVSLDYLSMHSTSSAQVLRVQ